MVEVTCKCGKTKKNFKFDVGSFVDECCVEAGYDELGNRVKKPLDTTGLPSEEELAAAAANLQPDNSPEPNDPNEGKEDESEETTDETKTETSESSDRQETKEEKKARKKAEKAALMAAQRKAEKEAKGEKAE